MSNKVLKVTIIIINVIILRIYQCIILLMKSSQQQFKIELILRNSQEIQKQHRKHSAQTRSNKSKDLQKERQSAISTNHSIAKDHIIAQKDKKNVNHAKFLFKEPKQRQYRQFEDKCINFLSKKKLPSNDQVEPKTNNFGTMLQNIKNVIKQNERRQRLSKEESTTQEQNKQLECARSQIHQIYANEDRIQLFRMIRSNQSKNNHRKQSAGKLQKNDSLNGINSSIYILNPFFKFNTIVCFTMALNEPPVSKKPLFEAPNYRITTSSLGKRVQICRPSQQRTMSFQLNREYDSQYMKRLKNFLDFLFKINFSNNLYVPLDLNKVDQASNPIKYKIYIGKGNNSLLIKSLIKRRFWWQIVDSKDHADINFYWSQNILDHAHNMQKYTAKKCVDAQKNIKKIKSGQQTFQLNRKILPLDKCSVIEKYILKDGYSIPFQETFYPDVISNHLPRNYCIGSKKSLFKSLFNYFTNIKHKNPFDYIPKTYHILSNEDKEYKQFIKENQNEPERVWIIKPGQNSNRGNGIRLATFKNIHYLLKKNKHENGQQMTYIVQSYINRPFLYCNRKFDIRHYLLLTSINGIVKAYWYREGYIRTSSQLFDLQDLDNTYIHLTNDAIQRNSQYYEKYQPANKLSYAQFQRYLDYTYPSKGYNFEKDIMPKMKQMATNVIKANYLTIDHKRHQNNFQIFGLDFMIDRDFKTWLIQVNFNPCLEINCPLLERIIPSMVENSFRIGLDPIFPPTSHFPPAKRFYLSDHYLKNLRYELIFDEDSLKAPIYNNYDFDDEKEQEQQYQNQGQQVNELVV